MYKSYKYLTKERSQKTSTDTSQIPKGGIIEITIPYTQNSVNRYAAIKYVVQTMDGKEIRSRGAENIDVTLSQSQVAIPGRDASSPSGYYYASAMYYHDTLHLDEEMKAPFQVLLYESGSDAKGKQVYKIWP